ncbi:MAG: LysR family transcriptional regulator [Phycisphaeraceae bacterium JB051]
MLNLNHVQAFIAVIETGSFRGASRRLSQAQPTLSQWIRKLESELDCPLIVRNNQRCQPTRQGQMFLPYARSLIQVASQVKQRLAGKQVVIGAASNIGIYILPEKLKQLAIDKQENIRIDLLIGSNPDMVEKLESGEIDIAAMEWWDNRPGFEAHSWLNEQLVIIVPPDHPWSSRQSISLDELAVAPMLGGERGTGTGTRLRQLLDEDAQRLKVSQNLGSTEAVKRAVMAGLGISMVAKSAVTDELAAQRLCALTLQNTSLNKQLYLVAPTNLPKQSPTCRVLNELTQSDPKLQIC